MYDEALILIGPKSVGKSTLIRQIGMRLKWPLASLDQMAYKYYASMPIIQKEVAQLGSRAKTKDPQQLQTLVSQRILTRIRAGTEKSFRDEKHFQEIIQLHALENFLAEHRRGALELGSGHAIFENQDTLEKAKSLLESYPHVIGLLPDPDPELSVDILMRNLKAQGRLEPKENITYYATRSSYRELATQMIYTKGKNPVASCMEILQIIGRLP